MRRSGTLPQLGAAVAALLWCGQAYAAACDHACLEKIGDAYRAAYLKHDPKLAPISPHVRFSENTVEMKFPDASWDTVTEEVGPAVTFSDPETGGVGIYTAILQKDTPAFLAIRLKVVDGQITEIEHMMATKRLVSGPPTPFGDVHALQHDPDFVRVLAPSERSSRAEIIRLADGYFSTLDHNDGAIRGGVKFGPHCHRIENGMETAKDGCEHNFKLGYYRFNNRVRDRDYLVVDESRGIVMARAFIDHKGVLDTYKLTDGTEKRSIFREPHTWTLMEAFKVENGALGPIETDFNGAPYYERSPWAVRNPGPSAPAG